MLLGAHLSAAAGLRRCLDQALEADLAVVQLRTRSARRWFTPPLEPDEVLAFRQRASRFQRDCLLALASPLINLASPDETVQKRSMDALYDELMRAEALGMAWVIIRPGHHGGKGDEWGVREVIGALNKVLDRTRSFKCGVLIENAPGEEHELGAGFEQLSKMRRRIDDARRVAICLDTAKLFASGNDLRDLSVYRRTMSEVDRVLGIKHVKACHLCDATFPLGSRRSGPTHIGEGEIGTDGFACFVNDPHFESIPLVLETPRGKSAGHYERNLSRLRSLVGTVTVPAP